MLVAENLSVKLGAKKILSSVSLKINPGEVLAVIGPNGAGKSTLLKTLCGDLSPTNGKIMMNGLKLEAWSLPDRAVTCAVLPQNSSLSFPFSVLDVVLMGRSPHFHDRNADLDFTIACQALALTGILKLKDQIYTVLSGGERQRVQFARVIAQIWTHTNSKSRYLLLDEPTTALDIACQHDCLRIARRFAKEQSVGVLAILHDLNLAALYGDRVAVLQNGHLVAIDAPIKILNKNMIEDVFNYSVSVTHHPKNKNIPLVII